MKKFYHLDFEIDKPLFRKHFWENYAFGQWHEFNPPKMMWWKVFNISHLTKDVELELNIYGLNNFPRFSYQFPNTYLPPHLDEDKMCSININLLDTTPTIHIENNPYRYEACFVDVGSLMHSVEPDLNERLILKFAIRHSWEEVFERLNKFNLIL